MQNTDTRVYTWTEALALAGVDSAAKLDALLAANVAMWKSLGLYA